MKRIIKRVKRAIYAQAIKRNEFMLKLLDISWPLIEHLIKYYCATDDSPNLHHWATEIYAFIPEVKRLKGSNKLPSQSFLYEHLYVASGDCVLDRYKGVCTVEHLDWPADTNQMEAFIESYCYWLCSELSHKGSVSSRQVSNQLETLKQDALEYLI